MKKKLIFYMMAIMLLATLDGCKSKSKTTLGSSKVGFEEQEEPKELTMPITFINATGVDICSLYSSVSETDDWEEDILEADILKVGDCFQVDYIYYENETIWDFAIEYYGDNEYDEDNMLEFYDLDFSEYDSRGACVVLNEDGTADITPDAGSYQKIIDYLSSSEAIYSEVLDDIYEKISAGTFSESYYINLYDYGVEEVGYAFLDIDDDGIEEMFLSHVDSGNDSFILEAYATDGECVYKVASSTSDENYYLRKDWSQDGNSAYIMSHSQNADSEVYSYNFVCEFSSGNEKQLELESGGHYTHYYDTDSFYMGDMHITEDEYWNAIYSYAAVNLDYTPLSEYRN